MARLACSVQNLQSKLYIRIGQVCLWDSIITSDGLAKAACCFHIACETIRLNYKHCLLTSYKQRKRFYLPARTGQMWAICWQAWTTVSCDIEVFISCRCVKLVNMANMFISSAVSSTIKSSLLSVAVESSKTSFSWRNCTFENLEPHGLFDMLPIVFVGKELNAVIAALT